MKIDQCLVLTFAAIGLSGCVAVKPAYGPDGASTRDHVLRLRA